MTSSLGLPHCCMAQLSTKDAKNLGYCMHNLAVCVASHYYYLHRSMMCNPISLDLSLSDTGYCMSIVIQLV